MALTALRDTKQSGSDLMPHLFGAPVAAATIIYQGGMVAINAAGNAVPASADATLKVIGRAESTVDNSAGIAGDETVQIRRGVFRYANSATTGALTDADRGRNCYVVDDETVSRLSLSGARPAAGKVFDVDDDGVWVEMGSLNDGEGNVDLLLIAGSSLTAAQYLAVAMASDGEVDLVGAAGAMVTGILQNAPATGAVAIVRVAGISKWIAVGAIEEGLPLAASTTTGKSKAAVVSDASAVGSHAFAIALTPGATDTAHQVLITHMGLLPATAA